MGSAYSKGLEMFVVVWLCVEGVFEPLAKVWLVSQKSKEIQSSHNSFGEKHVLMNLGH